MRRKEGVGVHGQSMGCKGKTEHGFKAWSLVTGKERILGCWRGGHLVGYKPGGEGAGYQCLEV